MYGHFQMTYQFSCHLKWDHIPSTSAFSYDLDEVVRWQNNEKIIRPPTNESTLKGQEDAA